MATEIKTDGQDLDAVFAPYESGSKAAPTGFKVSGVDLCDRFAPYVSGDKAASTRLTVQGNNLNNIFAKLIGGPGPGGIVTPASYDGLTLASNPASPTGPVTATVRFIIRPDGLWEGHEDFAPHVGNWFAPTTTGIGSGYEARFTLTYMEGQQIPAPQNDAPDWTPINGPLSVVLSRETVGGGVDVRYAEYDLLVEVRNASTGAIVSSGQVHLQAYAEVYG